MIVMNMMMTTVMIRMLSKTLAPCLDFPDASCLLSFKKLIFLMMTALWWMMSSCRHRLSSMGAMMMALR